MNTRLVDQDMRHLAHPVFDILYASGAMNAVRIVGLGRPERRLVDPNRFPLNLLRKSKCLEHLHRAHADAIRLTFLHRSKLGFDNHGANLWHRGQLRRKAQTCRTAPRDQYIHFTRQCA